MTYLDYVISYSLIPIIMIFLNVKVSSVKHFKICSVSIILTIFLRFFFWDYNEFLLTKMVYLFMLIYALQMLFEWERFLKLMGVIPEEK
jgi:hypothetical protein